MADNPITTPLPADLPTNWAYGQTVAPTGAEVGLTQQHGYNYLMEQVNAAQSAANLLGSAFEGVPSKEQIGLPNGIAGLDAGGRVPVAQLPVTNLTLYLSPNGVDAPNRGTEAEPLKTIYYAINTFSTPTRILNLQLNPGSYGWVDVKNRWVSLAAVDPNNKPILTGMEVDQLGFASLTNCKIQGALSNGDTHISSSGKCRLYNVDFICTGGTGNSSGVQLRGGDALISGCTFSGYRHTVIGSYAPVAPTLVISRNNSGDNPSAYGGVLVAVEGVIIWRQGTQPTGAGGTTTVVTENGGQVYGG